jgi:hypothetical protein
MTCDDVPRTKKEKANKTEGSLRAKGKGEIAIKV